ncbi:MAG: protein phosphatase 2C domain-containing protein [Opitutaceae bacterium]
MDSPVSTPSLSPAVSVRWSGITDRGRVRTNNEDAFLALAFDGQEVRYLGKTGEASLAGAEFLFAVSDGMGGAKSGEIASRLAVDRIAQLLPQRFATAATAGETGRPEVLAKVFSSIHHDLLVLGASYEECAGMGATLSLCWLSSSGLHFGHVGDSRIYSLPAAGGISQLTDDHNHVGWLRRRGQITEREARNHPLRHSLHQAIGAGLKTIDPHIGRCACGAGDRFLICSDGVTDGLWDRHLNELVRDPVAPGNGLSIAQRIVKEAVEQSGRDNATALVFELLPGVV